MTGLSFQNHLEDTLPDVSNTTFNHISNEMHVTLSKKRRGHIFFLLIAIALALATGCGDSSSNLSTQATAPLVIISDIHFTPFYDTELFNDLVNSPVEQWASIFQTSSMSEPLSWGNESNYPLLVRALDSALMEIGSSPVLLFPGDILAHKFPEKFFELYGKEDEEALRSFVYKTVVFFATQIRERFGDLPVVFALGNNDSYAGDYKLVPGGEFLADTAEEFYDTLLLGGADHEGYFKTYPAGGYYVADPPESKVLFVCLNTILFSRRWLENNSNEGEGIALKQLDWLEQTLAEAGAAERRVWLIVHIPPGADIFATVTTYMDKTGHISNAASFWEEEYQARFLEISTRYAHVIEAVFAGHTHMDEYRLLLENDGSAHKASITTPSVSPVFGNDPAFKVVTMDRENWELLDYRSVAYHLGSAFPEFSTYYVFSEAYSTEMPLELSLISLFPNLATDTLSQQAYARFYYSGHNAADNINATNWPAYWCGIGKMVQEEYIECVNSYRLGGVSTQTTVDNPLTQNQ